MDLALNNLRRLICHKIQPANQPYSLNDLLFTQSIHHEQDITPTRFFLRVKRFFPRFVGYTGLKPLAKVSHLFKYPIMM